MIRNSGYIERKKKAQLKAQKNAILFQFLVEFFLDFNSKIDERKMSRLIMVQGLPTHEKLEQVKTDFIKTIARERKQSEGIIRVTITDYILK